MGNETCQNPWNRNCSHTDIVVSIMVNEEEKPICRSCWRIIADSDREWGSFVYRDPTLISAPKIDIPPKPKISKPKVKKITRPDGTTVYSVVGS